MRIRKKQILTDFFFFFVSGDVAQSQLPLGSGVPLEFVPVDPRAASFQLLQQQQAYQQQLLLARYKEQERQLNKQHQKQQQELIMVSSFLV